MKSLKPTTSEIIRLLMARKDISSYDLAATLNISPQALNHNIRSNNWNTERLEIIARFLDVNITELL